MISNRNFTIILSLCIITYLLGMLMIPLMDIDASQYASISREMMVNKSYLQVFDLGRDYLDKPPMLFWLSALSMKIFGVYDWAYRLPSFLFTLLAILSTYRLAALFYSKTVAQLSALVLASSQALFLITHDVRCDTMLMGWVALSLWQLAAWYETGRWKYFLVAFIAIAGGMMTKGPIALMVPVFAFLPHFILRREWKQFFRWEYLIGILIIALLLVPMSIGLYEQFDLHPGKIINGVPIKSGLRFYYWTQSFGRYTGENVFNEMNDFTFLLQNMLWSFLPWIIFFLLGLVFDLIGLVQSRFRITAKEEWLTAGGFIITYCVLGKSQAQLPHYIFVVFPLASIVTAKFLNRLVFSGQLEKWRKGLLHFHTVVFTLLWAAAIFLMIWPFDVPVFVAVLSVIGLIVFFWIRFSKKLAIPVILGISFFTVIGVNIFMDTGFYPNVLKYQLGNDAAAFINQNKIPKNRVKIYAVSEGRAFHFYGQSVFQRDTSISNFAAGDIVLTQKDSLPAFQSAFPKLRILHEGNQFGVSMLTLPFLNPATREKEVTKYLILQLDDKH